MEVRVEVIRRVGVEVKRRVGVEVKNLQAVVKRRVARGLGGEI